VVILQVHAGREGALTGPDAGEEFGTAAGVEELVEPGDVEVHGVEADAEVRGDLFLAVALYEQREDFAQAWRERARGIGGVEGEAAAGEEEAQFELEQVEKSSVGEGEGGIGEVAEESEVETEAVVGEEAAGEEVAAMERAEVALAGDAGGPIAVIDEFDAAACDDGAGDLFMGAGHGVGLEVAAGGVVGEEGGFARAVEAGDRGGVEGESVEAAEGGEGAEAEACAEDPGEAVEHMVLPGVGVAAELAALSEEEVEGAEVVEAWSL
jgi:hypothetical protein